MTIRKIVVPQIITLMPFVLALSTNRQPTPYQYTIAYTISTAHLV